MTVTYNVHWTGEICCLLNEAALGEEHTSGRGLFSLERAGEGLIVEVGEEKEVELCCELVTVHDVGVREVVGGETIGSDHGGRFKSTTREEYSHAGPW